MSCYACKAMAGLGVHKRLVAVVLVIITATPVAVYYFQGYSSVNSINFYWIHAFRWVTNNTVYFNVGFELVAGSASLPLTLDSPRFVMIAESRYVGTLVGPDEQIDHGYGRQFHNFTFNLKVAPGETSLCSQGDRSHPENLTHNWTLTVYTLATAGWSQAMVSRSSTQACFWGWIT